MITFIKTHRYKIGLVVSAVGGYLLKAEIPTETVHELLLAILGG